jgi:hypothetical protein
MAPLRFIPQGTRGAQVTLTVQPKDYWQFDSYGVGTATTALSGQVIFRLHPRTAAAYECPRPAAASDGGGLGKTW